MPTKEQRSIASKKGAKTKRLKKAFLYYLEPRIRAYARIPIKQRLSWKKVKREIGEEVLKYGIPKDHIKPIIKKALFWYRSEASKLSYRKRLTKQLLKKPELIEKKRKKYPKVVKQVEKILEAEKVVPPKVKIEEIPPSFECLVDLANLLGWNWVWIADKNKLIIGGDPFPIEELAAMMERVDFHMLGEIERLLIGTHINIFSEDDNRRDFYYRMLAIAEKGDFSYSQAMSTLISAEWEIKYQPEEVQELTFKIWTSSDKQQFNRKMKRKRAYYKMREELDTVSDLNMRKKLIDEYIRKLEKLKTKE